MRNLIKEIDSKQLKRNALNIKIMLKTSKFGAVVKSNAYGHGLIKISKTLEPYVDYFCVNDSSEALRLRKQINKPILILGNCVALSPIIRENIEFSVSHLNELTRIEKTAKKLNKTARIHIALDTGLHRLGTSDRTEINKMLSFIKTSKCVKLMGVFSHLGNGLDAERTNTQIAKFNELTQSFPVTTIKHLFNSTFFKQNEFFDMVRIGIGLYGYNFPFVAPVLTIKARIIETKQVKNGEQIGYGNSHKANSNMNIAIIAAGYNDGIPFQWKRGYVLYKDKKCPFVADICMNMSIIKARKEMKINDYVTILGKCDKKSILASEIAKTCKTNLDEILTRF